MKALIQRVKSASVTVNGEVIASINQGFCAYIGICQHDTFKDIDQLVHKVLSMKLFDNPEGARWEHSVTTTNLEILIINQSTLYTAWKGHKPDLYYAMSGDKMKEYYEKFVDQLKSVLGPDRIKEGKFGEYMEVHAVNDGPVTFMVESVAFKERLRREKSAKTAENSNSQRE